MATQRRDFLRLAKARRPYGLMAAALALGVALLIAADGQRRAARLVPLDVIHSASALPAAEVTYVLNTGTRRFHRPDCPSVQDMKPKNRSDVGASREDIIAQGFKPCGRCNP